MAESEVKSEQSSLEKTGDEKIVDEAKKRYTRVLNWEGDARKRFIDDIKFANGDSDNMYQWPNSLVRTRGDERPNLTINKLRQHNLQIMNDCRQNKPGVKVKAVGNGATYESAQIYEGVVRHIEYMSNAQSAYDVATKFQVEGGIGYVRVVTDYAEADTFDQEIFIRPFKDPLTVLLDCDIKEADGSDAAYAIVFDDMPKDEAEKAFPKYKDSLTTHPLSADYMDDWTKPDTVRICEYYRKTKKRDRLVSFTDAELGETKFIRASKLPKAVIDGLVDDPQTRFRDVEDDVIEWFLIIGDRIVQRSTWPGRYIPIVRFVGEETIIQGVLDRKGHTRAMKDPQRIYNYWSSAAVEHVALQSKTPYIGPMDAFTNMETYWDSANVVNHAWLPYNGYDDSGRPIPPPQRQAPPVMSEAYIKGMMVASDELRSVSGQYQAELGMPSNEKSGIAIQQRQRQGDNATYHFIDNQALAIRYLGKILIDLVPKVYDTQRIVRIMAEDGVETEVQIDPTAQAAYLQRRQQIKDEASQIVFNPSVGRYSVEADVGPAFATRRQEAFNAMFQVASQNPDFMRVAGDLLWKASDVPMADELAQRFKRSIPEALRGVGPSPEMQSAMQQVQRLQTMLQQAVAAIADLKKDKSTEGEQKNIDWYKAESDRMKVLSAGLDMNQVAALAAQMVMTAFATPGPGQQGAIAPQPPMPMPPMPPQGAIQ